MSDIQVRKTPLDSIHRAADARMVEFAGWILPMQFGGGGFLREHRHTRESASLFDVSHMGQLILRGENRAAAMEKITPAAIGGLAPGKAKYTLMLNENGGVVDDLIVANDGDAIFLVVNAARYDEDLAHLKAHLPADCKLESAKDGNGENFALVALQGPRAAESLRTLCDESDSLAFMEAAWMPVGGANCRVARTGYTGEDGFEISIPSASAESICRRLLELEAVSPAGLGARDSLRLEAGLCLYGNDLDETTTPAEAGLMWTIPKSRRESGGFVGFEKVKRQMESGAARRRVGLKPDGKIPVRSGAILLDDNGGEIGVVTSGVFSPTLESPIAMGYVAAELSDVGGVVFAEVRGRKITCQIAALPFVPRGKSAG